MHNFQDYFQNLKSKLELEQVFNIFAFSIIFFVVVTAVFISSRAVDSDQYVRIKNLAFQQTYPDTQHMAEMLLMQDTISKIEFNRLMYAQYVESSNIKIYPAEDPESYSK